MEGCSSLCATATRHARTGRTPWAMWRTRKNREQFTFKNFNIKQSRDYRHSTQTKAHRFILLRFLHGTHRNGGAVWFPRVRVVYDTDKIQTARSGTALGKYNSRSRIVALDPKLAGVSTTLQRTMSCMIPFRNVTNHSFSLWLLPSPAFSRIVPSIPKGRDAMQLLQAKHGQSF